MKRWRKISSLFRACCLWGLLFSLCGRPSPSLATEEEDKYSYFIQQYLPHLQKLKNFYENILLEADCEHKIQFDAGGQVKTKRNRMSFLYKARHPLFSFQTIYNEDSSGIEPGTVHLDIINRRGHYFLASFPGQKSYYLERATSFSEDDLQSFCLGDREFTRISYCVHGADLSQWLQRPMGVITGLQKIQEKGQVVIKLTYRRLRPPQEGYMIFLGKNAWALREFVLGREIEGRFVGFRYEVLYEHLEEEVPWLQRVIRRGSDSHGAESESLWTIRRLVLGPVPEEEFTPAAYGLAEPREPPSIFSLLFWLALALLLLTILARLLLYLLRRRKRVTT